MTETGTERDRQNDWANINNDGKNAKKKKKKEKRNESQKKVDGEG